MRMTVELTTEEFRALAEAANKAYRHPRAQAAYILRLALIGDNLESDLPEEIKRKAKGNA